MQQRELKRNMNEIQEKAQYKSKNYYKKIIILAKYFIPYTFSGVILLERCFEVEK